MIKAYIKILVAFLIVSPNVAVAKHSIGSSFGRHRTVYDEYQYPSGFSADFSSFIYGDLNYTYESPRGIYFTVGTQFMGDSMRANHAETYKNINLSIGNRFYITDRFSLYGFIGGARNHITFQEENWGGNSYSKETFKEWGTYYGMGLGYQFDFGIGIDVGIQRNNSKHMDSNVFSTKLYYSFGY